MKINQKTFSFSSIFGLGTGVLRNKTADILSAVISNTDCLARVMQFTILATAIYWLQLGKHLWFVVGIVCVALSLLPAVLLRNQPLRAASSLCITTLLFAHIVFGMQAGFYETSTLYDKVMHVLGSGAIAGLTISVLCQYCESRQLQLPLPLLLISVLGGVIGLGTLWEVFEFAIDSTGLFRSQRGLHDTMLDLIADTVGALVALGIFAGLARSKGRRIPGYRPSSIASLKTAD